jgi:hypothetical protein
MPRPRAFAAIVGLAVFAGMVGPWSGASASSAGRRISLSSLDWIFYKEDFNHLNVEVPALMKQVAAGPATYVLEQRAGGDPLPASVIPVQYFFSSAALHAAIAGHKVIPGVRFVADDLEDYAITPATERKNPIPAMRGFSDGAHANGYRPILIPGRDLMRVPRAVCSQRPGTTISQAYLRCDLPAAAAYAPIYVIQAAAVETNLPALLQLVQDGVAQARKANPHVAVFATLSPSPNGSYVPAAAVAVAAEAIRRYVDGFFINDLRPDDSGMIGFLKALSRT